MVRRHGWELPAHAYQVVAITVFFLLATAFYVFLAPFLGNAALEVAAITVYSSVALAVFVLYVRCTAINPADPGVSSPKRKRAPNEEKGPLVESCGHSPISSSRKSPSISQHPNLASNNHLENEGVEQSSRFWICVLGWLVKGDNCRKDGVDNQFSVDEDVLFCTLCNAEVRKHSKHCRSCDKCVDGFDHHCRWLNNCVGRKNYATFVSLMATCILMLVLDWGVGLVVLVRCFANKTGVEKQIVNKLGSGFSRAPFAVVVGICTLVPLLASIPLGELFFFHIILIRKGITTYEYVVAMRAQNEPQGLPDVEQRSAVSSPTSSTATGLSGSSSLGLQYRGAWCTPPRVFVEHQEDEIIPHLGPGRVPSTVDPDVLGRTGSRSSGKRGVRISAWKLAKLDPSEAVRAASKARESSSVLRPVVSREVGTSEVGYSSSSNISVHSSMVADYGLRKGSRRGVSQDVGSPRTAYPPSRATSKDEIEAGGFSQSSLSSPGRTTVNSSAGASPLPLEMRLGGNSTIFSSAGGSLSNIQGVPSSGASSRHAVPAYHTTNISFSSIEHLSWVGTPPVSDGCDISSGGNSADETTTGRTVGARQAHMGSNLSGDCRSTVYWDRVTGRFIAVPTQSHLMRISTPSSRQNPASAFAAVNIGIAHDHGSPNHLSSVQDPPARESASLVSPENLTYTGTSIFFGGPLSMLVPGSTRKENSPVSNLDVTTQARPVLSTQEHQGYSGLRGSYVRSQSPVFVPAESFQTRHSQSHPTP